MDLWLVPILVALITAVGPSIAVLIVHNKMSQKLQEIHLTMNSRLDELVKASKEASYAAGKAEGVLEAAKKEE